MIIVWFYITRSISLIAVVFEANYWINFVFVIWLVICFDSNCVSKKRDVCYSYRESLNVTILLYNCFLHLSLLLAISFRYSTFLLALISWISVWFVMITIAYIKRYLFDSYRKSLRYNRLFDRKGIIVTVQNERYDSIYSTQYLF